MAPTQGDLHMPVVPLLAVSYISPPKTHKQSLFVLDRTGPSPRDTWQCGEGGISWVEAREAARPPDCPGGPQLRRILP